MSHPAWRTVALSSVVVVAVASCALPRAQVAEPAPGIQTGEQINPGAPSSDPTERGVMPKRVVNKQDPNILVADDGTSCTVSAERYRKIGLGKFEVCAWR